MHPDKQRELVRIILNQIEDKSIDMSDCDVLVDTSRYYDQGRLAREEAVLFHRHPMPLAHEAELPAAGDFRVHDESGVPILLVRGEDGKLRAFLNICRHRGTRLATTPCGHARGAFTCPYHAWSYGLDGQLLHVPHSEGFPGLAALGSAASSLIPLPVQVAYGIIWVTPSPAANTPAISALLGPIDDDLAGFHIGTHAVFDRRVWQRSFNWKLALEGFFENYHVRVAHRDSIYPYFVDHAGIYESIGRNLRLVAPRRSIATLAGVPEHKWGLREHAVIVYFLFPSTVILIEPDHIIVFAFYPKGTDSTVVDQLMLIPQAPESEKVRKYWEKNLALLLRVFEEDFSIGELIQRGIRHNPTVRFGRFEKALVAFHASLDHALSLEAE